MEKLILVDCEVVRDLKRRGRWDEAEALIQAHKDSVKKNFENFKKETIKIQSTIYRIRNRDVLNLKKKEYRRKLKEDRKMMELNVEKLKNMKDGEIFARGTGTYPEIVNREIKWVAVRGVGYFDWAIYAREIYHADHEVASNGDKIHSEALIKRLVPCDDEAFKLYRG